MLVVHIFRNKNVVKSFFCKDYGFLLRDAIALRLKSEYRASADFEVRVATPVEHRTRRNLVPRSGTT
jgi:hypothetical protein